MSGVDFLPRTRVEGLITTETESDLLIYDTERNELHTLNLAAAAVWRVADGSKSLAEIAAETDLEVVSVKQAVKMLTASNLLVNGMEEPQTTGRRRLLKKAGIVAIPAIVSVSIPLAQAAASCTCTSNNECNIAHSCSGNCIGPQGGNIEKYPPGTIGSCRHS